MPALTPRQTLRFFSLWRIAIALALLCAWLGAIGPATSQLIAAQTRGDIQPAICSVNRESARLPQPGKALQTLLATCPLCAVQAHPAPLLRPQSLALLQFWPVVGASAITQVVLVATAGNRPPPTGPPRWG